MYSPEGKLIQLEYVQKRIKKSSTIIAIKCKDGLVVFAEKPEETIKKGFENRSNMIFLNKINVLVGTGLVQDFQRIIERAKFDSISFRENFSSILTGKVFASRIASLIHLQTKYWHIRPLCCSLFLATINLGIPELYIMTQTGQYLKCCSGSLGEKSEICKITIDKLSETKVTCRKSILEIYRLFKEAKKEFDYRYLEVSCFSMDNFWFKTPISCNLMIEVNRRFHGI